MGAIRMSGRVQTADKNFTLIHNYCETPVHQLKAGLVIWLKKKIVVVVVGWLKALIAIRTAN